MSNPRQSLRWLAAELLVVVMGILLALQAESLRERWSENQQGVTSLESILADLRSDSVALDRSLASIKVQDQAVRRLADHFSGQRLLPDDSVTVVFRSASLGPIWNSNGSAYWGLRDSGRLELIRDEKLRSSIVAYYDGWSPYLLELLSHLQQAREDLVRSAMLDFVAVPVGPETEDPFIFELTTPVHELPSDPEFRGQLGYLGRWTWWLAARFQVGVERNAEIISSVSVHLSQID
jgi:hypothetical protein